MSEYNSNYEIAQAISERIGVEPIPFDSVYEICLAIYNELGGEPARFDSVYEILLGILPLAEGSGSGKAIETVDELPEASENKNKFFRLSTDENVYVSELKSRTETTTNRLPDEQQIDKAYLMNAGDVNGYYKGIFTLVCTDGEIVGYGWGVDNIDTFTTDDAVNINDNTYIYYLDPEEWNIEGNIATTSIYNVQDVKDSYVEIVEDGTTAISATYNAPETAQIGNAIINDSDEYLYTGREITLVVSDGEFKGYGWEYHGDGYCTYLTDKKASDIYCASSGQVSDVGVLNIFSIDDYENWTIDGDTYTDLSMTLDDIGYSSISNIGNINIPQLNAPDEQQFAQAQIEINDTIYTYIGEGDYIDSNDVHKTLYGWKSNSDLYYCSLIPAEEIYGRLYDGDVYADIDTYDFSGTVTDNGDGTYTLSDEWSNYSHYEDAFILHNFASYQREETVEVWDWRNLASAIVDIEGDEFPIIGEDGYDNSIIRFENKLYAADLENEQWQPLIRKTITGTADLNYNQDMSLSTIENVEIDGDVDITTLDFADAKMTFTMKVSGMAMGTIEATGTFNKYSLSYPVSSVTNYRFTFPFMNLAAQSQDMLFVDYNDSDNDWTAKLAFAASSSSIME